MTAAEVKHFIEGGTPGVEVVQLEVTDGETYNTRTIGNILGVIVGHNVNTDSAHINATWSGQVITINANGVTNEKMTLQIFGTP